MTIDAADAVGIAATSDDVYALFHEGETGALLVKSALGKSVTIAQKYEGASAITARGDKPCVLFHEGKQAKYACGAAFDDRAAIDLPGHAGLSDDPGQPWRTAAIGDDGTNAVGLVDVGGAPALVTRDASGWKGAEYKYDVSFTLGAGVVAGHAIVAYVGTDGTGNVQDYVTLKTVGDAQPAMYRPVYDYVDFAGLGWLDKEVVVVASEKSVLEGQGGVEVLDIDPAAGSYTGKKPFAVRSIKTAAATSDGRAQIVIYSDGRATFTATRGADDTWATKKLADEPAEHVFATRDASGKKTLAWTSPKGLRLARDCH